MRALVYDEFGEPPTVREVPDPELPGPRGAVIKVEASGLCRSDWHGWLGHDPDIRLPHVPGHELAGTLAEVGAELSGWAVGDRVTVPFVCGCGSCPQCMSGNQQICDEQFQPGFTAWGSFADYVAIDAAVGNLVRLPDDLLPVAAASLGCRFATAYRAVVQQGAIASGDWVAVHGCGGVGLAAVMVAVASGARVVGVDVSAAALDLARQLGAEATIDVQQTADVPRAVREVTGGGAHVSLDALGSETSCAASVLSLRKRGRHVQVGLLPAVLGRPAVPMDAVIAGELEIVGSHGMAAHAYDEMLELVATGRVQPEKLVTRKVSLDQVAAELVAMADPGRTPGVTVMVQ